VVWRDGDGPGAKRVEVAFAAGVSGRFLDCLPPSDLFTVTSQIAGDGSSMSVTIMPISAVVAKAVSAHADLVFEMDGRKRKQSIWGMLLPPSFR
jgi:hypothetical protein